MTRMTGLSTRYVHAGEIRDASGSPHTPLYSTTTFAFDSTADLLDVVEGRRRGNLYTRYGLNPSILSLEEKLASLVTQPVTTPHHGLNAEERARHGIADAMIRLSVGLEDPEDLIDDLAQALR